jgi:peptidoglycan LD-endopeptidase LytH
VQTVVTRNAGRLLVGAALVLVLVGVLMVALIGVIVQQQQQGCGGGGGGLVGGAPTKAAENAIPAGLLAIYRAAEQRFGVPWNVLAAINRIETDFGRNMSTSSAGAIGWMQFMPATWTANAVDADGDGKKDPYNPADAIFTAAKYLKASGSDHDLHGAVFAYNHAEWYVQDVLAHARLYAQGNFTVLDGTPVSDAAAAESGALGYPLARRGPVIATPADHQRRPLGNWQSDNAFDIAVPAGTAVLAVANATVINTGGSPPTHSSNVVGGFSVTLRTAGNEVFYTHMMRAVVHPGERVRAGQKIGLSGYANNVEHLHLGLEHGDPLAIWGDGAAGAVPAPADAACASAARTGLAELDKAVTANRPRTYTTLPAWATAPGHPREQVDTRILPDALWILRSYGLRVTAAREPGHNTHGDGTALDLVPASGGDQAAWDRSARRLAHDLGWTESCASSGVAPACPLKPAIRGVFYNGHSNHGDPAHCSGLCHPHIHISWYASSYGNSALSPPNAWVRVFPVPTTDDGSPDSGVPVSAPAPAGAPSQTMAVVGDSLGVGTEPDLKADLPGWQIFTDAKVGRPLADGMRIVEAIEGTPAVLAISLFTNDDPRHTSALAAAARRSVQGQRCVLWATIHRPPVAGVSYAAANRTLHRLERQLPALHVVPWAERVVQHPSWIGPDDVHATATGWAARARLYATAAAQCAT